MLRSEKGDPRNPKKRGWASGPSFIEMKPLIMDDHGSDH